MTGHFTKVAFRSQLAGVPRFVFLLLLYSALILGSLWVSFQLRFDFEVPAVFWQRFLPSVLLILPVKLLSLAFFGQFGSLLTFFSLSDSKRLVSAMATSFGLALVVWYATGGGWMAPRAVLLSDLCISLLLFFSVRTCMRLYRERVLTTEPRSDRKLRNILIIGAGTAGAGLFRDIHSKPGLGLRVVGFIDDDPLKIGGSLHGRSIMGPRSQIPHIATNIACSKAIIAMPTARPQVIRETVALLNEAQIEHDILPSVSQLLHRQVSVNFLRHVDPEDLLGREAVALDEPGLFAMIEGQTVMVTGAGGSIGSELCRQLASFQPKKLLLVERSEPALFEIEQELKTTFPAVAIEPFAANVCHRGRLSTIFARHRPSLVFHAAAHKHVPLMESQPGEAILNNCLGSLHVGELAAAFGCRKAVLVSTDKAVNPVNVMGATKRIAELLWAAFQGDAAGEGCTFSAVRFGNVLGSSGSVIPVFRKQIAQGGPVTVTHPDVTRYFMSIPEAAGLILQSAFQSAGGEVFVLDMGDAVKISDLARQMIELSGFRPDEDIAIVYGGLRPGEKLYEEPIHKVENVDQTTHPKIKLLRRPAAPVSDIARLLREAEEGLFSFEADEIKTWLARTVPEYRVWTE